MIKFINLDGDGSSFNVEQEFLDIINQKTYKNVFISDVDKNENIKFKFDLVNEPRKSYCSDISKIKELK